MQDYQPISFGEQRRSERPMSQSERMAHRNRIKKKKQKQHRMLIGGASALLVVIIIIIILIVKGCSGATDALAGTWNFDSNTTYEFDGKGSGAMVLSLANYDFTYEIKDNQLYIDFSNESVHDATYEFSVKGDTLTLVGGEGTIGGTYELNKVRDKKAEK